MALIVTFALALQKSSIPFIDTFQLPIDMYDDRTDPWPRRRPRDVRWSRYLPIDPAIKPLKIALPSRACLIND